MPETIWLFGRSVSIYYLWWFIAIAIALLLGVSLAKDFNYSPYSAFTYTVVALLFDYLLIWITSKIFGGFNLVRSVSVLPLAYLLEAKVFGKPFRELTDFLSPLGVTCFGITHFGCMFPGCCHGYPSPWGIYSNVAETVCFPVQPIEAVVSLGIGGLMYYMVKQKKQKGLLVFWMMTLFGSTRFILEFFRDNEKVFLNISELALHALLTFIVGVVMLVVLKRFDKKEHAHETI